VGKPDGIKTLAAESSWDSTDDIGVFMVDNATTDVRNEAANKQYRTADGSGNFTAFNAANTIYYPVNGDKVDFIAYYPYDQLITTLGDYSVDVSNQTASADIDLLYATANNGDAGYDKNSSSLIALTFNHKLSKLTLNITNEEDVTQITAADLAAMTVSIAGLNTKATFNLAAGTLGAGSTKAAITPRTVTAGAKYEAILLPETFTGATVTFAIPTGSSAGNYNWTIPDGAFDSGKEYVYTVAFTGTNGAISVTGTIDPWIVVNGTGPEF
jgi:hypothetical protein